MPTNRRSTTKNRTMTVILLREQEPIKAPIKPRNSLTSLSRTLITITTPTSRQVNQNSKKPHAALYQEVCFAPILEVQPSYFRRRRWPVYPFRPYRGPNPTDSHPSGSSRPRPYDKGRGWASHLRLRFRSRGDDCISNTNYLLANPPAANRDTADRRQFQA